MLHGDEFGWRDSKLRPCLLIEVYENHPIAAVRPRTTTGRDGRSHSRHPHRHAPRCKIDQPGKLPEWLGRVRTRILTPDRFSCSEPDQAFLQSILPGHLR